MLLAGQAHESTQFEQLASSAPIRRPSGQIRWRPRRLGADKAYHAQRIRHWLRAQGIGAVIPPRATRAKKRRVGRPFRYDKERYRGRNVIERSIGWLKECRSLATRFEKLAIHYLGMVQLAIIERFLKRLAQPVPQT
jgi:transposase